MTVRGWKGFGSRLSTGTSVSDADGGGGSDPGRSADSPLPSAFLFMSHQLLGELQIGLRPARPDVVEKDRLAEARRLAELDVPRNRGGEDLLLEVLAYLPHH